VPKKGRAIVDPAIDLFPIGEKDIPFDRDGLKINKPDGFPLFVSFFPNTAFEIAPQFLCYIAGSMDIHQVYLCQV